MGLSDQRDFNVPTHFFNHRSPMAAFRTAILGFLRFLGLFGLLAVFFVGMADPAAAQGAVKGTYGDWQIRCDTPAGAQSEQCALIQSVVAEDRSNAGLTVIILKTRRPEEQIDAGRRPPRRSAAVGSWTEAG